jgi:hypothetical protein
LSPVNSTKYEQISEIKKYAQEEKILNIQEPTSPKDGKLDSIIIELPESPPEASKRTIISPKYSRFNEVKLTM